MRSQRPARARLDDAGVAFVGGLRIVGLLCQGVGGVALGLAVGAQVGMAQGELGDAAVHDRGRRLHVAVSVGQLRKLPEQPRVGRQPQGQLLRDCHRLGRQLLALRRGELAGFVLVAFADEVNVEQVVEVLSALAFFLAQADQLQMIFLRLGVFAGREADGLLQTGGGLLEIALHLPGRAEVGGDVEVLRMIALGAAQQIDRLGRLSEANVQRAEVGDVRRR